MKSLKVKVSRNLLSLIASGLLVASYILVNWTKFASGINAGINDFFR